MLLGDRANALDGLQARKVNQDNRPIWGGDRVTIPNGVDVYVVGTKGNEIYKMPNPTPEDGPKDLSGFYFVCVASNMKNAQRKYKNFLLHKP